MYIIQDWAGNEIILPTTKKRAFKTFDDAEYYLSIFLGDDYDDSRVEYYIVKKWHFLLYTVKSLDNN